MDTLLSVLYLAFKKTLVKHVATIISCQQFIFILKYGVITIYLRIDGACTVSFHTCFNIAQTGWDITSAILFQKAALFCFKLVSGFANSENCTYLFWTGGIYGNVLSFVSFWPTLKLLIITSSIFNNNCYRHFNPLNSISV